MFILIKQKQDILPLIARSRSRRQLSRVVFFFFLKSITVLILEKKNRTVIAAIVGSNPMLSRVIYHSRFKNLMTQHKLRQHCYNLQVIRTYGLWNRDAVLIELDKNLQFAIKFLNLIHPNDGFYNSRTRNFY